MKRRIFFFLTFLLISAGAYAQEAITIRGTVLDKTNPTEPLTGAMVKLNPADSAGLTKPGRVVPTNETGLFTLTSTLKTNIVEISYLGFKTVTLTVPTPEAGKTVVDLGKILMSVEGEQMKTAVVTGQAITATMLGDTLQYNAAAFKTNPDATSEDLLKKLPGVTTNSDGQLESAGKAITKVYVNGKEYFEDDPSLALKSLPVDAVESVQLYDDKTEDAKFSGFDDGERIRAVNIVTKKNVINSMNGKVYGGYGTSGFYAGGAGLNLMTDNHRLTITAQSNNVNNQGFTMNDISSGGSGGGGRFGVRGGGSGLSTNGYTTSVRNGLMKTNAIGANYNGEFGSTLKLSAQYFFNGVSNNSESYLTQNYLTMPRYYEEASASEGYQYNHRFSAKLEWNPSENDRVTFRPRINYSTNRGGSENIASTYNAQGGTLTNSSLNHYDTQLQTYDLSADLWWQHRFDKAGRTLSLGGNVYALKGWGDRYQNSVYQSMRDGVLVPDSIRQFGLLDQARYTISGSATYTEPISQRSRLSLNYTINYDRSISNRKGLNWDKWEQDYVLLDTLTTNYLTRNYTTNTAALSYNYVIPQKLTVSASVRFQNAVLNNKQLFPTIASPTSSYSFNAVLPSLNVRFTPNKTHTLNLNYNAYSIFPSVNQLQDLMDVTNILQVSTGNPNLKQSYSNNLMLRYQYNNIDNNVNAMVMGMATATSDYIANHRRFLTKDTVINGTTIPAGAQFTSPVNLNGYMNARVMGHVNFPINPLKSKMTVMGGYTFTQSPSIENYIEYKSLSHNVMARFSLTSNISEKIDFTLSYMPQMTFSNTGQGRFDRYYSHRASADFNIYLWPGGFIWGEASWVNSYGTQESYSQHYALINAAIGQKFYKNMFEVKLAGYDLLAQNRSFWQTTADTYVQTTTQTVLPRYFMASLTWRFDTRKSKTNLFEKGSESVPSGIPMGPPPGGGTPPSGGGRPSGGGMGMMP